MRIPSFSRFVVTAFGLSIAIMLVLFGLTWLQLPAGRFVDWIVAIMTCWWLVVVLSIPWKLHFAAQQVIYTAHVSRTRGISQRPDDLAFAQRWQKRTRWFALILHAISALGLYAVAALGISPVGYIGAIAALALTGLPPLLQAYTYLSQRLTTIDRQVRYPHDDVAEVRTRLQQLQGRAEILERQLNPKEAGSWPARFQQTTEALQQQQAELAKTVAENHAATEQAHNQLAQETRETLSKVATDQRFLEHMRELIQFFKRA